MNRNRIWTRFHCKWYAVWKCILVRNLLEANIPRWAIADLQWYGNLRIHNHQNWCILDHKNWIRIWNIFPCRLFNSYCLAQRFFFKKCSQLSLIFENIYPLKGTCPYLNSLYPNIICTKFTEIAPLVLFYIISPCRGSLSISIPLAQE
jgi:hypothetical protein